MRGWGWVQGGVGGERGREGERERLSTCRWRASCYGVLRAPVWRLAAGPVVKRQLQHMRTSFFMDGLMFSVSH